MNRQEVEMFIEEMEYIGDVWTPEQVEDVYGDCSLREALAHRNGQLDWFFEQVAKAVNMPQNDDEGE